MVIDHNQVAKPAGGDTTHHPHRPAGVGALGGNPRLVAYTGNGMQRVRRQRVEQVGQAVMCLAH